MTPIARSLRAVTVALALGGAGPAMAEGTVFVLKAIDSLPFSARATIGFTAEGRIAGDAPCNRYSGSLAGSFPDFATGFAIGPIAATRMACADLAAETAFFQALGMMTAAAVDGPALVLSDPETGRRMVFQAAE